MRGRNQYSKNVVRFGTKDHGKNKKDPDDLMKTLPLEEIEDLPLEGEEENKFVPTMDSKTTKLAIKRSLEKYYGPECRENPVVRLLIGTIPRLWFEMRRASSADRLLKLSSELRGIFTALQGLTGKGKKDGEQSPINPLAEMSDRDLEKEIADGERILGIAPGMKRYVMNSEGHYVLESEL